MLSGQDPNRISRLDGKKAVRAYARRLAEPETITDLNITPMMDMRTIILVFLLKSFAASTLAIPFDDNLKIPASMSRAVPRQAIAVMVTKNVVLIEGQAVAPINNETDIFRAAAAFEALQPWIDRRPPLDGV